MKSFLFEKNLFCVLIWLKLMTSNMMINIQLTVVWNYPHTIKSFVQQMAAKDEILLYPALQLLIPPNYIPLLLCY